jgi:hypothetical protein
MSVALGMEIKPLHATVSLCLLFLKSPTPLSAWQIRRTKRGEVQSVEMCLADSIEHTALVAFS